MANIDSSSNKLNNKTNKSTRFCSEPCCNQRYRDDRLFSSYYNPTMYGPCSYISNPPSIFSQPQPQQDQQQTFQQESQQAQQPTPTTNLSDSGQLAEVLNELTSEISKKYVTGKEPQLYRQVITVPGPPGKVLQAFRRLPTPSADVFQRIYLIKPQRDVIDLLISVPSAPSTQYSEKTVYTRPHRPLIIPRLVQTLPTQNDQSFDPGPQMNIPFSMSNPTSVLIDPSYNISPQPQFQDPQYNSYNPYFNYINPLNPSNMYL